MTVESANKRFWLQMTKESTIPYCLEMLKLDCGHGPDNQSSAWASDISEYMDYVVEKTDAGVRDEISPEDSPFPKDLLGFIHDSLGICSFQPAHLMCKLGILRNEKEQLTYEFLIEYDIFHPDVEIYYGVKAISDSVETTPEFKNKVISDWKKVRAEKKYLSLAKKFKLTNNGDNGTFWPFWLRVNMDGKSPLGDAVKHLSMFYEDYRRFLHLNSVMPPRFSEVNDHILKCTHRPEDYDRLITVVGKRFGMEGRKLFENVFIKNCLERGYIYNYGETTYCVTGIPNYKFTYLARLFFMCLSYLYGEGQIPQKEMTKVFLGKKKTYLTASDWGKSENDMPEEWKQCEKEVREWLDLRVKF